MFTVYAILKYFPYWAFPVALIIAEVGLHYRRKGKKKKKLIAWALSLLILVLIGLWIYERGDRNAFEWARAIVGEQS